MRLIWCAAVLACLGCQKKLQQKPAKDVIPRKTAPAPTTPLYGDRAPVGDTLAKAPAKAADLAQLAPFGTHRYRRPVGLVAAPGDDPGRVYVVEQTGTILVVENGVPRKEPFLDVSQLITRGHNEQGLLGLAFHPGYRENGRFFINYSKKGRGTTIVAEYQRGRTGPVKTLLALPQPYGNHNGGHLEFGPGGRLYVGLGDGGSAGDPKGYAQRDDSVLGKMLSIDVDTGKVDVVAKGLRNPWRYHFDSKTSDLYIADVGQNTWEWIHVVPGGVLSGQNFGWNTLEGRACFQGNRCDRKGLEDPEVVYSHEEGCSITGGHVYRGSALPALEGTYFYADYCTAWIRSFRWDKQGVRAHWDWKEALDPGFKLSEISAFGLDAAGELYVLSLGGRIYKLIPRA